MTVAELDGSVPKTKFREQFLQKLQREGQISGGKENKDSRAVSHHEGSGKYGLHFLDKPKVCN